MGDYWLEERKKGRDDDLEVEKGALLTKGKEEG